MSSLKEGKNPGPDESELAPSPQREVIEVEAVALDEPEEPSSGVSGRLRRSVTPIVAGVLIDAADLTTSGPVPGLVLGSICGLFLARHLRYGAGYQLLTSLACGIYCTVPPTKFFPLATMLGVWANLRDDEPKKRPD